MNTYKKWFPEVVEILKIVSYEPAYHGIMGQKHLEEGIHSHVYLFFIAK